MLLKKSVRYCIINKGKRKEANAVTFDMFLADYGSLPSAYFKKNVISNPTELFWSEELLAILRLCGAREEMIGERASDYERFLALCQALPQLVGHPTRTWIESVLAEHFLVKELPTEENVKDVWKMLCERLFENPISPNDLVSGAWLCDSLTVPNTLPHNVIPMLNGNLLLGTRAKNVAAWSAEIAATVAQFFNAGCQKIIVQLQDDFHFISPSIYHVDRALSLTKKDSEAYNLLTCQLVRELCSAAQKNDLLLVLVCNDNPAALVHLLEYAEESVGLSRICWSVREASDAHALLAFTAKPHKSELFAALSYETVMTERELLQSIESWQMRYPVGRLCFLTKQDLRQTPYVQAHIAVMLDKLKQKSKIR